jgi:hypothetical protein
MSSNNNERLGKLILMLGSSHDGEVVAAARAINRLLKGQSRDLHTLAAFAGGLFPPVVDHAEVARRLQQRTAGKTKLTAAEVRAAVPEKKELERAKMAAYYREQLASRYDEEIVGPAAKDAEVRAAVPEKKELERAKTAAYYEELLGSKERRSLLKQIAALDACVKDTLQALGFRAVRGTKYAWRR